DVVDAGVHDLVREPPDWDAADRHCRTCAFEGRAGVGPLDGPTNRSMSSVESGRSPVTFVHGCPQTDATKPLHGRGFVWSGRRDSNPRPSPWQGDALPAEPRPQRLKRLSG